MDSKKLKCVIKLGSVEISCLIAELDLESSSSNDKKKSYFKV